MTKSIFVGNLPTNVTENELQQLFAEHGTVCSVMVIKDRISGQSRGFGIVEMEEDEANYAIEQLNGVVFLGQNIQVAEPLGFSESQH